MSSTSQTSSPPRTVLVVEDERLLRWTLAQHLGREGFRVLEADTGCDAEALVRSADLAILDLKLPDSDGLEELRSWRAAGLNCPVIIMSAYMTAEREREALDLGVAHVARKPFDIKALLGVVRRLLP